MKPAHDKALRTAKLTLWIILLIFPISLKVTDGKKDSKLLPVRFLNISIIGNPKFVKDCVFDITPESNGASVNLKANLILNIIHDLSVSMTLYSKSTIDAQYKEAFSYDVEICKIMEGFMSATIARLWGQSLRRYSNLPLSCPIKEGEYYIRKLKVDRKMIPPGVQNGFMMAKIVMYLNVKPLKDNIIANTSMEVKIKL